MMTQKINDEKIPGTAKEIEIKLICLWHTCNEEIFVRSDITKLNQMM
ncbi:MAG TPA: hypothetical protein VMW74_03165 [Nitrosopumilaceae archaeon]|nr:hypothetical protein [Nitrosopumilaceae archaeon]